MKQSINVPLLLLLGVFVTVIAVTSNRILADVNQIRVDEIALERLLDQYVATIQNNAPESFIALCTDDATIFIPEQKKAVSIHKAWSEGFIREYFEKRSAGGCNYNLSNYRNWRIKDGEVRVDVTRSNSCPELKKSQGSTATMGFRQVDGEWKISYFGKRKR